MKKYKVDFVIVSNREYSYWLPRERDSFRQLVKRYPRDFRLEHEEPQYKIFRLLSEFS